MNHASTNLLLAVLLITEVCEATVPAGSRAAEIPCGALPRAGKIRLGGPCQNATLLEIQSFRHDLYDGLLRRFVDGKGQVCYRSWRNDLAAFGQLAAYLHSLGSVDMQQPVCREQQLAFYINAYNALTIWAILREYPLVSVQALNREGSRYRIFDDVEVWIGGQYLSLNAIENEMLRPLGDFRIHFALVCAAKGCPRLRNEAYRPECVDWQLDQNAVDFFAQHSRFHIHRLTKTVHLSPILKWYGEDFGENKYQVVTSVFRYLPQSDQTWLSKHPEWRVTFLGYDWGLNDQCPTTSVKIGQIPYCLFAKVDPFLRSCRQTNSDIDRSPNGARSKGADEQSPELSDPGRLPLFENTRPPSPDVAPNAEPPLPEPLVP